MSLLGGYKKRSGYDGYESLQLVDSGGGGGDFNSGGLGVGGGGGGGGGGLATVTPGSKARPDHCSIMEGSGKALNHIKLYIIF